MIGEKSDLYFSNRNPAVPPKYIGVVKWLAEGTWLLAYVKHGVKKASTPLTLL